MPKAFQPRPGRQNRRPAVAQRSLSRDIVDELRRSARPADAERAITTLERAVELLERGDVPGALKEAERAKGLAPRSGAVRETLGLALYGAGRWRDAIRELQAYRRMSGRQDQNHIIADAYRGVGQPERGLEDVMTELRTQAVPEEAKAEATVVGASALADLERYDEALALLRRFPTRETVGRPHDLRIWYVTGDVLERAGRREEAEREFRRVLRFDASAFDAAERVARLQG
jgi:tetratricopeptide (TPR) repeat protein